jgi:nucleotide-binding universal stress UspA family protein
MRFKKLLVPVDFSEPSRAALLAASQMCADTGAQMVLVHVWQPNVYAYTAPVFPVSFAEDYLRDAREKLAGWQQEAHRAGARLVSTEVLTGTPWHELVELLRKDEAIDLVVMGTHGHSGLKHVLLGSVAEKVVRHAPCPVLVYRTRS